MGSTADRTPDHAGEEAESVELSSYLSRVDSNYLCCFFWDDIDLQMQGRILELAQSRPILLTMGPRDVLQVKLPLYTPKDIIRVAEETLICLKFGE